MTDPETPEDLVPEDSRCSLNTIFPMNLSMRTATFRSRRLPCAGGMNEREKEEFLLLYAPGRCARRSRNVGRRVSKLRSRVASPVAPRCSSVQPQVRQRAHRIRA